MSYGCPEVEIHVLHGPKLKSNWTSPAFGDAVEPTSEAIQKGSCIITSFHFNNNWGENADLGP